MEKSLKTDSDLHNNSNIQIQDPTSKCKIEQAERILHCINQKLLAISGQLEERKFDRDNAVFVLKNLKHKARSLKYSLNDLQEKLQPLQLAEDKLSFKNKAYYGGESLFEDDIDLQNLQYQLVHGSRSLVEERRLLKKTNKSRQRQESDDARFSSFEQISFAIASLHFWTKCSSISESRQLKIVGELKESKWKREKAIANAAVKGRIWNSLGSKKTIKDNIKGFEKQEESLRKDQLALRPEIKKLEKKLEAIENNIIYLQKQLIIANQTKGKAYQCLIKSCN